VPGTMLLLVGEQPAPNLLPARHLKPDAAVLVYSDLTERVTQNLKALLEPGIPCSLCRVAPYDLIAIQSALQEVLRSHRDTTEWVFNLTGGNKLMALAALLVAQDQDHRFVYFQTEGNRSRLARYRCNRGDVTLEIVEDMPEVVSLDEYLRMYLGSYVAKEPRNSFEEEVATTLRSAPGVNEVLTSLYPRDSGGLEVDFAVRCGNQVGIGEVKSKGAKEGIDQLAAVSAPRYLGTYVARFLVSGTQLDRNNRDLARAYRIDVIELLSYGMNKTLSPEDRRMLQEAIVRRLTQRS